MVFLILIVVFSVFGVIFISFQNRDEIRQIAEDQHENEMRKLEEKYNEDKKEREIIYGFCSFYRRKDTGDFFEIYEKDKKVIISTQNLEYKIDFKEIVGAEIYQEEKTITSTTHTTGDSKTKTGSMLGRAIVGGVLTGGAGAIIGGATAKRGIESHSYTQTTENVKYTLCISIDDISNPIIKIYSWNTIDYIQELYSILNIIIKRNNA